MMRSWALKVECAQDLQQAEQIIEEGFKPDIIISDYRLKQGRAGIELLNQLMARDDIRCTGILISGETSCQSLQSIQRSGYQLLSKPIESVQLRKSIEEKIIAQ